MSAKYLIRMDDACPTMSIKKWNAFETILDKYYIKPIVAVIPDNKDRNLHFDHPDATFWQKVKKWHDKGWHIALHGYDHLYLTNEAGLFPFHNNSEFAGLPLEEQCQKIRNGIKIFREHGIDPTCWIAPAHSFDSNTLEALARESNIRFISDGISLYPFKDKGFNWIPQQIWKLRKMPLGVWTCNIHPNTSEDIYLVEMESFIRENLSKFITIQDLHFSQEKKLGDKLFSFLYWKIYSLRKKN